MAIADRYFYYPTQTRYDEPENYGLAYESVRFVASDSVRLHGWFFPADTKPRGTVVHCHGNAGNITGHFKYVAWLPACGWNVLCFDYRGYGLSDGRVTRAGTVTDAHAALDYVRTRHDVDPDRVILFGQSIGGTIALVAAAQRNDLSGLAVEGAFSSYRTEAYFAAKRSILWGVAGLVARYLVSDDLSPIDVVAQIAPCPILFVCGTADSIVDCRQTVELYEAAHKPKQLRVVDGGEHCDTLCGDDDQGRDYLTCFLAGCTNSRP